MRPGWGLRHPELDEILARSSPAATEETSWLDGAMPLRVSAYLGVPSIPDELVTSVRCLVTVGTKLVVCTNLDGITHPWPGGRRQRGESFVQTAAREVQEETGWLLRPDTFHLLGWLHLEHLKAQPMDYPLPHPDFCQVVGRAEAVDRLGGPDAEWSDTEGYEASSALMTVDEAFGAVEGDPLARVFLPLLAA